MLTPLLLAAIAGYFLGALPFGYLVARANGVDIFTVGSKSPGATNVRRSVGRGAGNLVFALDALKGALAAGWILVAHAVLTRSASGDVAVLSQLGGVSWAVEISGHTIFTSQHVLPMSVTGLVAALLGHSFSCFTRFKGGKGVATGAGGLMALMPIVVLVSAVAWIVVFYTSRYVSLASIVAAALLPISAALTARPPIYIGIAVVVMLFVVLRHRANISRLIAGTENRFVKNPKTDVQAPKS